MRHLLNREGILLHPLLHYIATLYIGFTREILLKQYIQLLGTNILCFGFYNNQQTKNKPKKKRRDKLLVSENDLDIALKCCVKYSVEVTFLLLTLL